MKTNRGLLSHKAKNKSFRVLAIIGVVTTQLLITGCGPQEKQSVTDPIVNIDEYYKSDKQVVVDGEQKTIKELKEQYGYLYHMAIDYTDEEIKQMYTDMLHMANQSYLWMKKNEEKIMSGDLEVLDAAGYFMKYGHPNFDNFEDVYNINLKSVLEQIYESNDQFVSPYKKFISPNTDGSGEKFNLNFFRSISETRGGKTKIESLLSNDVNFMREQVVMYLLDYEITLDAKKEAGIPHERPADLKVK